MNVQQSSQSSFDVSAAYARQHDALVRGVPANDLATPRYRQVECRARILSVDEFSPADDAGFEPGCYITSVDGHPIHDIIDWDWYTDGFEIRVGYIDLDGDAGEVELWRDEGESWGISFDGAIFDVVYQCRNACTFCFMQQLPEGSRDSLMLRDDDYRLSFLQGTFCTFTNLTAEDERRIIEQRISPLRFSLHAASPDIRSQVIGRNAAHGIEAVARLLDAGIILHAQIVLMPGINDGDELDRTLAWAWEYPGIVSIGIVPLGFTKHQSKFEKSFNDVADAKRVIDSIRPFQEKARKERGNPWVFAADEFYSNAFPDTLLDEIPPTSDYGDFDMYEDGIGIIRSQIDDWEAALDDAHITCERLRAQGRHVSLVVGLAQRATLTPLVNRAQISDVFLPLYVRNDHFGGNVNVTGLLCADDIIATLKAKREDLDIVCIPDVIFNADNVTLDDVTLEGIRTQSGVPVIRIGNNATEYMPEIAKFLSE